ncbi:methyltransferase domain-containing protein [Streptomyces chrestomyceticus]|uniref:methyltransferase domain-containing protein n=1 Tax=Streptomyces chrestomyceticus TaxID=68185 RepID=UPI0033DFA5E1
MTGLLEDERHLVNARIRLARQIERSGVVLPVALAEAFLNVPRHPFVPVFYRREGDLFVPWRMRDGDPDTWLTAVYDDDSLITEVDGVHAEQAPAAGLRGVPTSSSTAPGLMADMLDALDAADGSRVLEVGTGTGYNAALLCRLAGDRNVTTIDHSPALTAAARSRLAAAGCAPQVLTGDGVHALPDGAVYDRIIATASVPRVPVLWLEHCRVGGLLVVPLKGVLAGGAIARLTRLPDGTAAGRLLHTPAAFMPLRPVRVPPPAFPAFESPPRASSVSARVLDDWCFSFFAQLHLPPTVTRAYRQDTAGHVTMLHDAADGSAARIADHVNGVQVTSVGPRDLWHIIERAHHHWQALHRPRREWFTLHVSNAEQTVTYTAEDGHRHQWRL